MGRGLQVGYLLECMGLDVCISMSEPSKVNREVSSTPKTVVLGNLSKCI